MDRPTSQQIIVRTITPLAVWAVTRLLETPSVKGKLEHVDAKTYKSLRRASRNATKNWIWLAGGAVAVAVGIGMIAKAARRS
jgi:hypothetical protein